MNAPPSKIRAAERAPDRRKRIARMADLMVHHRNGTEEGCSYRHLFAEGFTTAEIVAYRDPARELLRARERRGPVVQHTPSPARQEGKRLVRLAKKVRQRLDARQAQAGAQG